VNQTALDFTAARSTGEDLAEKCLAKARRVSNFDSEGARKFVLGFLRRHGPTSGETLVAEAKAHGYQGHDDRCFGAVFGKLSKDGQIQCLRSDLPRARGHATSGGRLWAAIQ
jgi:predicted TPR repeat methyltransferase